MPKQVAKVAPRRSGRRSPEEKVLEFFETANLGSAQLVLNLARGKVRARTTPRTRKPKTSRRKQRAPKALCQGKLQM